MPVCRPACAGLGLAAQGVPELDESTGGLLWHDGVSESAKAVHPSGNPISHSTHVGFSAPPTCVDRPSPDVGESPLRLWLSLTVGVAQSVRALSASISVPPSRALLGVTRSPFVPSVLVGVGHSALRAIVSKLGRNFPTRPAAPPMFPLKVDALGVGSKDEKPLSTVRRADFLRRPQCARNAEAHRLKLSGDVVCSERQMAGDVLEEAQGGLGVSDHASDSWPEVAWVGFPETPAGCGKRLAWVAANDAIHDSTPRASIEGSQVTPDRRRSQGSRFHRCRQNRGCERFPLDHAHRASSSEADTLSSEVEAEVKSANPGTQADGT